MRNTIIVGTVIGHLIITGIALLWRARRVRHRSRWRERWGLDGEQVRVEPISALRF